MSDSMHQLPQDEGPGLKIPILFGVVIALVAANVYLFLQLDQVRTEMTKMRESILTEVSNVRETSSVSVETSKRNLDTLREELVTARRQAEQSAGQAKEVALKHADDLSRKIVEEQRRQQEQVKAELSRVEQSATTKVAEVSSEVGTVKSEVGTVRSDLAASRAELERTIADLKRTNGDMGVQSGLIATNGRELAALKQLGERSYFEFNLVKSNKPFKLNDVLITLKKADMKANKYTIDLVADDKRFEKKDKNINEPVQFYMSKYRQPCEIVVNDIKKDRIVGYLTQPKVLASAARSGSE